MRKTMNLRALMSGQPITETVTLGDDVIVGGEHEKKREGVVKVPNGPADTKGVLIDGELEMVPDADITLKKKDESIEATDPLLAEGLMGMSMMPGLARMRQLAGIPTNEAYTFATSDDDADEDEAADETADETAEETSEDDAEAVTDDAAEEIEGDANPFADAETDEDSETVDTAVVVADVSNEVVDAAQEMTAAVETQPVTAVAANHPATAGEVTMMSAPVEPEAMADEVVEDTPDSPLQICLNAVTQIEQSLPNISVKDFNDVNKRINAILSALNEGVSGRGRKL